MHVNRFKLFFDNSNENLMKFYNDLPIISHKYHELQTRGKTAQFPVQFRGWGTENFTTYEMLFFVLEPGFSQLGDYSLLKNRALTRHLFRDNFLTRLPMVAVTAVFAPMLAFSV